MGHAALLATAPDHCNSSVDSLCSGARPVRYCHVCECPPTQKGEVRQAYQTTLGNASPNVLLAGRMRQRMSQILPRLSYQWATSAVSVVRAAWSRGFRPGDEIILLRTAAHCRA